MGIAFTLQAVCLVLVLTVGRLSGTLFTITLIFTFFTWGEIFSLFPSLVADYFGTRCATENYGVLYSAKGVASIISGRRRGVVVRALRHVVGLLLRKRGAGADRCRHRIRPACLSCTPRGSVRRTGGRQVVQGMSSVADHKALAQELAAAYASRSAMSAPSERDPGFDLAGAYAVESELVRMRRASGRATVGRKVGFANKAMWRVLKLDTLVWAHMYDDTVHYANGGHASLAIGRMFSPKIEPEIVFKLKQPLAAGGLDAAGALDAVEWLALGFEIIDCVFPDWRFTPADFVAAFGLHAALVVGEPMYVAASDISDACRSAGAIQGPVDEERRPHGRRIGQEFVAEPGALSGRARSRHRSAGGRGTARHVASWSAPGR